MTKSSTLKTLAILILFVITACKNTNNQIQKSDGHKAQAVSMARQDSIINEHVKQGAWRHGLYSNEWQEELNKGLEKDSTIAYLWQQKAMPLFKQGKYELGMKYLDKAVKFDQNNEWQEYRAFMKCIFSKTYKDAIADFEECKKRDGNSYVMDHTYNFYIALSKIQLNEYAEAEHILTEEVNQQKEKLGEEWVHHLDLFYLGISKYEQKKYSEAITVFDLAIKIAPNFSELYYYKSKCLKYLENEQAASEMFKTAKELGEKGYSVNEDNSIYERYPYQVRWELRK